jgi:hypothetical protein
VERSYANANENVPKQAGHHLKAASALTGSAAAKKKKKSMREPFVAIIDLMPSSVASENVSVHAKEDEELTIVDRPLKEIENPFTAKHLLLDNLNCSASLTPNSPLTLSIVNNDLSDMTRRGILSRRDSPESIKFGGEKLGKGRKDSHSPFKKLVPFQQFWNTLKYHPNKENIPQLVNRHFR